MKYEETPFGTKIVGLEDAIKAAVSDMMSWEELADRVLELEDQLTAATERERVLVETLECTLSALRIASRQLTDDMKIVLNGKRWGEFDIKRAEKVLGIKQ